MAELERRNSVSNYLHYSFLATAWVVLGPVAMLVLVVSTLTPNPPLLALFGLGLLFGVIAVGVGSVVWRRHPEAAHISFGELLIWGWFKRRNAEERVIVDKARLGLNSVVPGGEPDGREPIKLDIDPTERLRVLRDLTAALESKDLYTHGHSKRVERHVAHTAVALNLPDDLIQTLRNAAALHDVGKVRVPDAILRKEEDLSIEERKIIQEHPVIGARMVEGLGNDDLVYAVRHHHERWDGRGYPDGLTGTEIPLMARIIAVADAYDAMTSTRPYRSRFAHQEAVQIIKQEAGTQFDPVVVEAFVSTLPNRMPVISLIALSLPARLLRELSFRTRRLSGDNLAPAFGAAGAALVLGVSVMNPIPSDAPRRVPAAGSEVHEDGTVALGQTDVEPIRLDRDADARVARPVAKKARMEKPLRPKKGSATRRDRTRQGSDKGDDDGSSGGSRVADNDDGGSAISNPAPDIGGGGDNDGGNNTGGDNDGNNTGGGDNSGGDGSNSGLAVGPQGDPKPGKGEDCSHDGANSKGRRLHCG